MRHHVRKARVCVVNRLTKEIKKLRTKNGNEKQRDKYNRKATRLVNEIFALKRVKDDEISKFGINNSENLNEILTNPSLEAKERIIAKVAHVKSLRQRVENFKEKFPHSQNCLNSNKKRSSESEDDDLPPIIRECKKQIQAMDNINLSSSIAEPCATPKSDDPHENTPKPNPKKKKNIDTDSLQNNKTKIDTCKDLEAKKKTTNKILKINSKVAVVKRFNQLLETEQCEDVDVVCDEDTTEPNQDELTLNSPTVREEVDDFFTYADGKKYLRVVTDSNERIDNTSENVNEDENLKVENPCKTIKYKQEDNNFDRPKQNGMNSDHRRPKKPMARHEPTNGKKNTEQPADGNSLHPSWVAKKKQQDLLKQGFQGKKIVFDD